MGIDKNTSQWIEALRGGASLCVFFSHLMSVFVYPVLPSWQSLDKAVASLASFSVGVFFTISGYVITFSVVLNYQKNKQFNYWQFASNRLARLFPGMLLALCVSATIIPIAMFFSPDNNLSLADPDYFYIPREEIKFDSIVYVQNFFFLQRVISNFEPINNNGPLWTLSIEFWIYMWVMVVAMFIFNSKNVLLGCLMVMPIVYLCVERNIFTLNLFLVWLLGSFVAIAQMRSFKISNRFMASLSGGILFIAFALFWHDPKLAVAYSSMESRAFQFLLLIVGLISFVLFRVKSDIRPLAIMVRAGQYSFSIYIFHFPIFLLFFYIVKPVYHQLVIFERFCLVSVVVLITLSISIFLGNFIEGHSVLYKKLTRKGNFNTVES